MPGSLSSPWVSDVGESSFRREVIERSRDVPVVVDFWAEWCGPCRLIGPILERLVTEREGEVLLAKVDIEASPSLAAAYNVTAVPTVIGFRRGKAEIDFTGVLPEAEVRSFLDRLCPSEAQQLVREAAALGAGEASRAEELYRTAIEKDLQNEAAAVGLARLLAARGEDEEAERLVDSLPAEVEVTDELQALRAVMALRKEARRIETERASGARAAPNLEDPRALYELGIMLAGRAEYDNALVHLLRAAEADKNLAREKVRDMMVRIFYAVGVRSPMADEYRAKLSQLLY